MLVSSSSALSPGLPFAIFTADLHYVPSIFLRNTSPPLGVQLTKFFFKPQLEELERERDDIQGFGTAVLEEWYKGLEARGREQNAIAARFELWAVQGGFRKPFAVARRGLSKIELPGGMSVDQEESAFQRQHVRQDKFSSLFAGDRPGSASKGDGILHGKPVNPSFLGISKTLSSFSTFLLTINHNRNTIGGSACSERWTIRSLAW